MSVELKDARVVIVMGSDSDRPVVEPTGALLERFGIPYRVEVASAHRSPDRLRRIVQEGDAARVQVWVGVAGLAVDRGARRWLWGALPWIVLLACHRTPTGGAGEDHRYLVPLMPVLAVGLGLAWQRWSGAQGRARWIAAALVALAVLSASLGWTHVLRAWG